MHILRSLFFCILKTMNSYCGIQFIRWTTLKISLSLSLNSNHFGFQAPRQTFPIIYVPVLHERITYFTFFISLKKNSIHVVSTIFQDQFYRQKIAIRWSNYSRRIIDVIKPLLSLHSIQFINLSPIINFSTNLLETCFILWNSHCFPVDQFLFKLRTIFHSENFQGLYFFNLVIICKIKNHL